MKEPMRLQKYLAQCGVASRRKAEEMIQANRVTVNNEVVTELGTKVTINDEVLVDGKPVNIEKQKAYILFYKPEMVITSMKDQFGRKTVMDYVQIKERIYPVGRLDYGTSGLLIMTNDGEFAKYLSHPRYEIKKTYRASIKGYFDTEKKKQLEQGIQIDEGITQPTQIVIRNSKDETQHIIEITIHEGKNRQIKKMFEAVDCKVTQLERISIGSIGIRNMQKGKWRRLTNQEIQDLGYKKEDMKK